MINPLSQPPAPGSLPDHAIENLIDQGAITCRTPISTRAAGPEKPQLQPASLDLRLGMRAWRLRASFLPGTSQPVHERIRDFEMHRFDLDGGAVLERGCTYLVEIEEGLRLPPWLHAKTNAKSSTGRLDILSRVITDGASEFDTIPPGYHGPLYLEICPLSFSVLAHPGQALTQIRLRSGDTTLDDAALTDLHAMRTVSSGTPRISDGLAFSVDLAGHPDTLVGYKARPHAGMVDLRAVGAHRREEFWEEVHSRDGRIILDPGAFYILMSREAVHVPDGYAAEMAPYLAMAGEFRVHYAGFFDPGFGSADAGGSGSRAVLEVRCHETPFALEHGQAVGRLLFERLQLPSSRLYGSDLSSNYQGQTLKLSKHFD